MEIDVVCLNEIFDEPARGILSAELESEFPFQVAKADSFHSRIVSPGISDDVMEKVWELTFGPLEDLSALAQLKFEDSGLFLASRLPFVTVPTPPGVRALLGPFAFPQGVPVVRFFMYADSSDNDKFAAKGVLYAALKTAEGVRHVFLSHTQADTDRSRRTPATVRSRSRWPLPSSNVVSARRHRSRRRCSSSVTSTSSATARWTVANTEWANLFGQSARRCSISSSTGGDATSARAAPAGAPTLASPPTWSTSPSGSAWTTCSRRQRRELAVQHLRVDKALADPKGVTEYLSDHQPLLADINIVTPFCTPATALVTPRDDVDFDHADALIDGMVRWYRFDTPGTYDVDLQHLGADTAYEIYLGDDFSTPQPPYREVSDPERGIRFVLAAPFFIKVFLLHRRSESSYVLRTHRHEGRTWRDAIVLVPGRVSTSTSPSSRSTSTRATPTGTTRKASGFSWRRRGSACPVQSTSLSPCATRPRTVASGRNPPR